jgi:RHS repeat-associated protein
MHSQFTLNANHQGADLAFFQEFKSGQDPNGTEYWYHYDGEGNIAATTKHKAQSDHTYRYDEYGLILPDNGTSLGQVGSQNNNGNSGWSEGHNNYTLTQKYSDPNSSLVYFGSRHYDPEMGVWLTQDSYRGAVPNPQSLHRYMYNYASPVNYQDQYGYCVDSKNISAGCPYWISDFIWLQPNTQEAYGFGSQAVDTGKALGSAGIWVGKHTQTYQNAQMLIDPQGYARDRAAEKEATQAVVNTIQQGVTYYKNNPWEILPDCVENVGKTAGCVKDQLVSSYNQNPRMFAGRAAFEVVMIAVPGDEIAKGARGANYVDDVARGAKAVSYIDDAGRIIRNADNLPVLEISRSKMPNIAKNIEIAQQLGQPSVLTRTTNPTLITSNRDIATRGFNIISPDEYPFASTLEGGFGAQVKIVPLKEQQIQGGVLSSFYMKNSIQNGDKFLVKVVD